MLSLSTFVTRLSWLPAARSKAQFTCRAACWSSVPTPKAHTTVPLLARRRPPSSTAHRAGARRTPERRCNNLATSRSTMRAPSRIWRKRVWRQSQLRSSRSAKTRSPDITASSVNRSNLPSQLSGSLKPAKALVFGDCGNSDRTTDRFRPCDRKLHEANCRFNQETCEIDCVLDRHGFHKQEFKKFGRELFAQVGHLFSTQAALCSRLFKPRPEAKDQTTQRFVFDVP